jgi:transposase-like protein
MNRTKTQQAIIEQLKKNPIVQVACDRSGLPRSTLYRWKKQFKKFGKEVDEAIMQGKYLVNDMAESQLMSAIKDGNITACIYWLKNNHKDYATRVELHGRIKTETEGLTPEQEKNILKALELSSLITNNKIKEVPNEEE